MSKMFFIARAKYFNHRTTLSFITRQYLPHEFCLAKEFPVYLEWRAIFRVKNAVCWFLCKIWEHVVLKSKNVLFVDDMIHFQYTTALSEKQEKMHETYVNLIFFIHIHVYYFIAEVVILTKFGNFHYGIETKIWTASERFLEKFWKKKFFFENYSKNLSEAKLSKLL